MTRSTRALYGATLARSVSAALGAASLAALAGCSRAPLAGDDAGPAQAAPVDKTPPRAPPPVRGARLATPALPDLPALAAHEAPAPAPADTGVISSACRGVWSGTAIVPLVCTKSAVLFGTGEGGATPLVPEAMLHAVPPALPAIVDHRADGSEGPVRDQRDAPACTAFSMAAAIDHALLRWAGKAPPVSVMEIWSRYKTPIERSSIGSNLGLPIGVESDWPFNAREATGWAPCPFDGSKPPKAGCGLPIDAAHVRRVETRAIAKLTRVEYLDASDVAELKEKLAGGQDVLVTMLLPDSFAPKGRPGARYVPHWTKASPDAGHALVLAGYATLPHGTYFLMHNSWGGGWGDGGYAWLHEATLKAWGKEALVLDAQLDTPDPGQRPPRVRGSTTCSGAPSQDLVPDSIRGTCAPRCADGSPRHDGVCPVANQCPAGQVNLTGACVIAAPKSAGTDPKTGVAWRCGPGGCSYTVPRAVDATCTGNACMTSCPSPDFHLARAGSQLSCIE